MAEVATAVFASFKAWLIRQVLRLLGVGRKLRQFIDGLRGRVIKSQLSDLIIDINDITIFENSDSPEVPRMGGLEIRCENRSDIPFEVEQIAVDIEATGDNTPSRSRRRSFPVARIVEDGEIIEKDKFGHIDGPSTKIGHRKEPGSTRHYLVEFVLPSWLEVNRIYVRGFIELQRGHKKHFQKNVRNISYQ